MSNAGIMINPPFAANAATAEVPTIKPEQLRCCPKCYVPQVDLTVVKTSSMSTGQEAFCVCYDCQITTQLHWMPTIASVITKLAPEMEVPVKSSEQLILLCKLLNNKACL